ncbi:extracellular solute-binding protein [Aliamphritea spongicola]|nr:extracellular solute-binding protein [Aliamphritea spongicola]
MFSQLMTDMGNRFCICRAVLCVLLVWSSLPVSATAAASQPDVSPWQNAQINWRQFSGTTLSVLANTQPAFRALEKKLPYFEQLTGIKVGFHVLPQARMREVRRVDLAAGAGIYDVVPIGISYLGEAHRNGWLEPLQPYFDDPQLTDACWYDLADITPGSLALSSIDGEMLALPFDFCPRVFLP